MKKICVITRIRNDEFFIRKWAAYYGKIFGDENLYIYLDGEDQPIPGNCGRANIIVCERISGNVVDTDRKRLQFLSDRAAELMERYDIVIGCDADEFLVLNPDLDMTLAEYLSSREIKTSLSGLGVDVGQNMMCENEISEKWPFLSQRSYAHLSSRYTKPVVLGKKLVWGSGFHRIKGHNFHIDKNLYLFHFGCFDYNRLMARFSDKDRIDGGWKRHINKRTRTIRYVTHIKARNGEKWLKIARKMQTCIRPLFALNKPSMAGIKIVIRIPDKFKDIL